MFVNFCFFYGDNLFPACPSIIHKSPIFLSPLIMFFNFGYVLMEIVIDIVKM